MAQSLPEGTHTVVLALGDLNAIARGKRVQAGVWEEFKHGVGMCNAIFQMDVTNDIWDTPYANFANGYADVHIIPMLETMRPVPWEEGVVLVLGRAEEIDGSPVCCDPRNVLVEQVTKAADQGYEVKTGVEFEFYLLDLETKQLVDSGISVYGLARGAMFEHVVGPIRNLCSEMGIQVEMSNPEYAPGQIEINLRYGEALTSADNAMLFRNSVKEIAYNHGMLASFMAKPFFGESGNSFHLHQSLWKDGKNVFADGGRLSALGRSYLGGLQQHMAETALISAPTPNSMKRRQGYTFCPTSNAWGGDNRTVGLRVIEGGSDSAVRIEQRDGSSDANPYLLTAVQLASGLKGMATGAQPTDKEVSDGYAASRHQALPTDIPTALELFSKSELIAEVLSEELCLTLAQQAEREHNFMVESDPDGWRDTVTQLERDRYLEAF